MKIVDPENIRNKKHIYFVGIKGVAMASLAVWAKEAGYRVTGSDTDEHFPSDDVLRKARISWYTTFDSARIKKLKPNLVIYTGAHNGRENPEAAEAEALGIPVLPHGQALGEFMRGKRQISVAGSHGKTTTTAMIATILSHACFDPSYAIGCGMIGSLGLPGHFGTGEFFISEADEYVTDPGHDARPRFIWQTPEVFVVTNIDFDHPDVYPDLSSVQQAFVAMQKKNTGCRCILNCDDAPSSVLFTASDNVITYGFSPRSALHITHVGVGLKRTFFTVSFNEMHIGEFELYVPGRHNVANACAAMLACYELGVTWDKIREGLSTFTGTKRRIEKLASHKDITLYDDYAHHPKEIKATLEALRSWYPNKRIITVFQPHTFSRTKALLFDFASSFRQSDVVLVTDIYASAREEKGYEISSNVLVKHMATYQHQVVYAKNLSSVQTYLSSHMRSGDIIVLMGAGDIYTYGKHIAEMLYI